jgi:hypothetical protein
VLQLLIEAAVAAEVPVPIDSVDRKGRSALMLAAAHG